MSVNPVFSAGVVSATSRSNGLRSAAANAEDAPPVFSRTRDGRSLPALAQTCQINGHIPNQTFVKAAATGDLMRVVRDVKSGNVHDAQLRLTQMSTIELGDFLEAERIDPSLLDRLKAAIGRHAEPKAMLASVYEVLDRTGAGRLHGKLRPEASV